MVGVAVLPFVGEPLSLGELWCVPSLAVAPSVQQSVGELAAP
jgi:hypothetical protein